MGVLMIQEWAGDGFPGQWQHAGARTSSLCRDEIDRTAVAAHPSDLAGSTGCRWLMLAAEMAGVASDSWRPSPDPASTGLACLPPIPARTLGAHAGSGRPAPDLTIP